MNEHEIKLKVFARVLNKKAPLKAYFFTSFHQKSKYGFGLFVLKEVKPCLDSKMIKLLKFVNLFPPLRHFR